MSQVLNAEAVQKALIQCLFKEGEPTGDAVKVMGIVRGFGFHPQRLEEQRETVKLMLREIAEPFHEQQGGGWTFLNFCQTRGDGDIWTGMQTSMEELMCLGVGLGLVEEMPLPREILPGRVPYVQIKQAVWE